MRNQVLGNRYRILDRIGEGGMAYVYVALDEKLGRKVAIKVLHEHMEKNPDIRKRFQLEAQAVSSLEHPNIVKIYDFSGTQSERLWIVTEVIRGKNLAQYAQAAGPGWLHPVLASCIVREICRALDKAHGEGIVHRDIKPENVMLTTEGRVKLMDFGIAKDLGRAGMTVTGTFMGSPSYMSPEQIRGRDVDLRSDLYSLSVLFYEIVTGRLPYTGQTTHDVVMRIMEGEYTHPRYLVPTLPTILNDLIVKGMSKGPEARFQSAREFGREIDQFLGSFGFDESHIELERYFKDPQAYQLRLQKSGVTQLAPGTKATRSPKLSIAAPEPRRTTSGRTGVGRTSTGRATVQLAADQEPAPLPTARKTPPPAPPETRGRSAVREPQRSVVSSQGYVPPPPAPVPVQSQGARTRLPTAYDPPIQGSLRDTGSSARAPAPVLREAQQQAPVMPQRRAAPRYVRRSNEAGRRHVRYSAQQPSWLHFVLGALLVGAVGFVSVWGFWELQERLAANAAKSRELQASRVGLKEAVKEPPRKVKKPREGTPVTVKTIVKAPPAPKPAPTKAQKRVAQTTPRKTRPKAEVRTTVVEEQGLVTETSEVRRAVKKPRAQPAPSSQPAPAVEVAGDPQTPRAPAAEPKAEPPKAPEPKAEPPKGDASQTASDEPAAPAEPEAPKPAGKGRFAVSSQPAAEIYVNGRRLGTTIDQTTGSGFLTLPAGRHTLELRRQGYKPYKTRFELAGGEQKTLPQVALESDDGGNARQGTLTLRVSAQPASVVVRNLDTNQTQAFVLKTAARALKLDAGRYLIRIEYDGDVKEREVRLAGNDGITFSADFKSEGKSEE